MFGKSWKPRYHFRSAVMGAMGPAEANEVMGLGLRCEGIHVPKNPSPRSIKPADARHLQVRDDEVQSACAKNVDCLRHAGGRNYLIIFSR